MPMIDDQVDDHRISASIPLDDQGAVVLAHAFTRTFGGRDGQIVLRHLRRVFLARRVASTASDSELRHVEGQRSVVAYVEGMIERGANDA